RELLSVLLEAGATLNSAALDAGIVDKIRVFFAPRFAEIKGSTSAAPLGMTATLEKSGSGTESFHVALPRKLRNITTARFGPDFAVEGYLRNVYRTR
ncbi:MAG TPA: dihydrofolate reductase family protein, partial [Candidatus Acidoferrales bacterium]|nr:dihydrofolate reductase family protein [Candidatus Acidoferrales bacterium]